MRRIVWIIQVRGSRKESLIWDKRKLIEKRLMGKKLMERKMKIKDIMRLEGKILTRSLTRVYCGLEIMEIRGEGIAGIFFWG
jgi:hypothetical protein